MRNYRVRLYSVLLVTFLAIAVLAANAIVTLANPESVASGPSGCQFMSSFGTDLLFKNPAQGNHNAYIEVQTNDQSNNSLNINRNSKLEFFFKYIPRSGSLYQPMPIFTRTHSDGTSREQLSLVPYSSKYKLQYIYNSNGMNFSILGADELTSNCWKHVAIVYRDHSIELWRDGQLQGSIDGFSFSPENSPQNKLIFGRNLATAPSQKNGFNGLIDEVRISSIAEAAEATVPTSAYSADENTSLLLHLNCNFQDEVNKNTVSSYGQTVFVNPGTTSITYPSLATGCGPTVTPIPTQISSPSPSVSPTPTGGVSSTPSPAPTLKPFTKTHFCSPSPSQNKNNVPCFSLPIFLTPRSLGSQKGMYTKTLRGNSYYREVFTARDDDGDYLNLQFEITGVRNNLVALPGSQGSNCNKIPTPTPAPKIRGTTTYTICGFIPNVSSSIPENQRHINIHYTLDDQNGGVVAGDYRLSFY